MKTVNKVLEAQHLELRLAGRTVLEDVSLSLECGHFMGIVGPNGAGKSSLISLIVGLHTLSRGEIYLFGAKLTKRNRASLLRRVGYLHQLRGHQEHLPMRVENVVAMGLSRWSLPLWQSVGGKKAIAEALDKVDMLAMRTHDFRELSGGQVQRVRLARALVHQPELLLLDEPAAALDSKQQQQLYVLLRGLCDDHGVAIIMVEHDIAAITSHVDSVACLNQYIHFHAMRGEQIPEDVWHNMYGQNVHVIAHDAACIGCG
ncbi:MAG: ATP-binding cassette domain-containing protein [Mariprofundaceae bacterium]|nr:ATP-binding cassette domain-containing protein [Mariprofundaceae bacterium]